MKQWKGYNDHTQELANAVECLMKTFLTRTADLCTQYTWTAIQTFSFLQHITPVSYAWYVDTYMIRIYSWTAIQTFLSCSTSILSHMLAISPPAIMLCRLDPVADYSSSNHCTHHLFSLSPIKMISYIQHIKQNSTNIFLHFWQQWNQRSLDLSAFSPNRPLNAQKRQHLRVVCPKPGTFCQT